MENIKDKILKFLRLDNIIDNASGYVEARLELYKMEIREDMARLLAKALVYMIIGLFGFLLLVFFSIGLAQFLNGYFEKGYAGYWIVASIYGVVVLVFLLFRNDFLRWFEKHFLTVIKKKNK